MAPSRVRIHLKWLDCDETCKPCCNILIYVYRMGMEKKCRAKNTQQKIICDKCTKELALKRCFSKYLATPSSSLEKSVTSRPWKNPKENDATWRPPKHYHALLAKKKLVLKLETLEISIFNKFHLGSSPPY